MCVVYVCTYISLGSHLLSLSNNSKSCTNIYVFYVKRNVSSSPPLLGQSQQQITMKCRESFLLTWNSVVSHQMKMLFDISGFVWLVKYFEKFYSILKLYDDRRCLLFQCNLNVRHYVQLCKDICFRIYVKFAYRYIIHDKPVRLKCSN